MRIATRLFSAILAIYLFQSHSMAAGPATTMASPIRLGADGRFRTTDGASFVPLGGFHGNVAPVGMLKLDAEQKLKYKSVLWQSNLDLCDMPPDMLDRWFKLLADDGVTAIRLFPRIHVSRDVLDLCGKVNPKLQADFHRIFAAAAPYGIRFQLQIMPEPDRTGYREEDALTDFVIPRYTPEELANLTPAQRRFVVDKRRIAKKEEFFTDPDVLACQKLYVQRAAEWIATEPQVFALEIYNEQGWDVEPIDGAMRKTFTYFIEQEEIRWTAAIVAAIKQRLPEMPVCISHPGFGVTGYDPMLWMKGTGADFYSTHMYSGLCGENDKLDFAGATAATASIIQPPNFTGEWGILNYDISAQVRRRGHRDAIWLSLISGMPGFMQWTYDFPEEYRWPKKVLSSLQAGLPSGFTPQRPAVAVEIGQAYAQLHDNQRYPAFKPDAVFDGFAVNKVKRVDPSLYGIFAAYGHALDVGLPIRFVTGEQGAISLDDFSRIDVSKYSRPIQAIGGYQAAYTKDAKSATWLAYLRSRTNRIYRGMYMGAPAENPLKLKLDLPKGDYSMQLINLQTNETTERKVSATETFNVADNTSDDFVVVIRATPLGQ